MLGLATRMSRKAWRPPTRQSRESTSQRLTLPRLTPLRQPHTREHCEAGMTGLLGGRGAGMRAAASSKPASACPWKRDGRRPRFRWPSERPRKKGVRKTDPKRGPPDTRTTGLCSENGLLFFRKSRWVLGFRLRCFQVCARPGDRSGAGAEFCAARPSWSHCDTRAHRRNVCAPRPSPQRLWSSCTHAHGEAL